MGCTDRQIVSSLYSRSGGNFHLCFNATGNDRDGERPIRSGILLVTIHRQSDNQIITNELCRIAGVWYQHLRFRLAVEVIIIDVTSQAWLSKMIFLNGWIIGINDRMTGTILLAKCGKVITCGTLESIAKINPHFRHYDRKSRLPVGPIRLKRVASEVSDWRKYRSILQGQLFIQQKNFVDRIWPPQTCR